MNQQWYYGTKDNQQRGPVDTEVILEKLRTNELTRDSFIWREGMTQWQRIWTLMAELEAPSSSSVNSTPVTQQSHQYTASVTDSSTVSNTIGSSNNKTESAASPYAAPASDLAANTLVRGGKVIYAGFWRRLAAHLVDYLLVGIVAQIVGVIIVAAVTVMMGIKPSQGTPSGGEMLIFSLSFLVGIALNAVYYAWFHSSNRAATPGKMLVGIKVVRPDGECISFLRGIGRFFATYISAMLLYIGYIMAAFTDHKQALHDMMCDTWVVDKWAFTDRPQLQQSGLGTATVVILSIFGILFAIIFIILIIAIGAAIANNR